jgi:hypothetical protein
VRVLLCDENRRPFVGGAYQARYCSDRCRNRALKRPFVSATAIAKSPPTSNAARPESHLVRHGHGQPRRVVAMPSRPEVKDTSSSVTQVAAAMAALGLYGGANTPTERAAEARRLGGDAAYRLRLVDALLGAAQAEALVAESLPVSADDRLAAYE